jgi:hypothetical protein
MELLRLRNLLSLWHPHGHLNEIFVWRQRASCSGYENLYESVPIHAGTVNSGSKFPQPPRLAAAHKETVAEVCDFRPRNPSKIC